MLTLMLGMNTEMVSQVYQMSGVFHLIETFIWLPTITLPLLSSADHTHLAVWLLDGDASHAHLLRYALTEETYSSTLVMLTVSMTTPWAMLDQLQEWASLLQDHIDKLPFSAEAIREYQHKCNWHFPFCFLVHVKFNVCYCFSVDVRRWQEYVEPGDELETAQLRRTSRHVDGEEKGMDHLLPLPEGVLTRNLGLDIVVVVTKV